MYIQHSDCELLEDYEGNKPRVFAQDWKKYSFGLFKIWIGHQHYHLIDKNGKICLDESGKKICGKHRNVIEIKWIWK